MADQATLFRLGHARQNAAEVAARGCQAYPQYRDSGIEGVGCLPSHWRITPLKYVTSLNPDELAETTDPDHVIRYADIGNVTMVDGIGSTEEYRFEDAPSRARRRVQNGDTIISTVRTYLRAVAKIDDPPSNLIVSTGFAVLRPRPELAPGFLYRLVQAEEFIGRVVARSTGVSYPAIAPTSLARLDIWLPPLSEQQAIAGWLDERTRRIDELVAAKRRLIDLLVEQRTTVISHAVTKGLDPAAPMKPSGIDWLGDVPGHWEVKRLKFISHLQTGLTLGKKHTDEEQGRLVLRPYLRVANVQDGWLDLDHITEVEVLPERIARYELRAGDVLMTEGGDFDKLGRGYVYEGQIDGCLHQNHIFAVRPDARRLDSRFLASMMSCLHGRNYFTKTSQQTTNLASTNATKLGDFPIPLPPMAEQTQIMARVAKIAARLDSLTVATESAIARLTEYRQALISAAVTGKINVCGAAGVALADDTSASAPPHSAPPVIAGRINGATSSASVVVSGGAARTANKHFQRSVLAAEIIARIGQDRTFGRVKLQKALILAEGHLQLAEIESQPVRAAAGPFDNAMMRSIQSQLQKSQWYEYIKDGKPLKFVPLAKAGGHKVYFERYWGAKEAGFGVLMALLARLDTRRSEIVATLYSAWNDFLIDGRAVTDDALVAEVLTNWDAAKQQIPEAKWRAALPWMRGKGLVPTGYGAHTKAGVGGGGARR